MGGTEDWRYNQSEFVIQHYKEDDQAWEEVTAFAKTTGDLPALGFLAASGRLQYVDTKTAPVAWPDTGDIPRASGRAHEAKRILTENNLAGWRKAQAAKAGDAPAFSLPESRVSC